MHVTLAEQIPDALGLICMFVIWFAGCALYSLYNPDYREPILKAKQKEDETQ